jgi:hypothetical protein
LSALLVVQSRPHKRAPTPQEEYRKKPYTFIPFVHIRSNPLSPFCILVQSAYVPCNSCIRMAKRYGPESAVTNQVLVQLLRLFGFLRYLGGAGAAY